MRDVCAADGLGYDDRQPCRVCFREAHPASPPVVTHGARPVSLLPEAAREQDSSRQEELERLKKGLRFLRNPDTPRYAACVEEMTRLEALIQGAC